MFRVLAIYNFDQGFKIHINKCGQLILCGICGESFKGKNLFHLLYFSTSTMQNLEISRICIVEISRHSIVEVDE